jgi:Tannase and feruloyl esterase
MHRYVLLLRAFAVVFGCSKLATALSVIQAADGRKPGHVVFGGEPAGGREALRAAQLFPEDCDGVISKYLAFPNDATRLA